MSDYNTPYDEESSLFETITKTAFAGGVAAAGVYAYKNQEDAMERLNRVVNKIAPLKSPSLSTRQQQMDAARNAIISSLPARRIREEVLDAKRRNRQSETLGKLTFGSTGIVSSELLHPKASGKRSITEAAMRFDIASLADIKDAAGNSIGGDILKELEGKFGKAVPEFNKGTKVKFNFGGSESIEINFAMQHKDAWISKQGEAYYVAPMRRDFSFQNGRLSEEIMDVNTLILKSLREDGNGRLLHHYNTELTARDMIESTRTKSAAKIMADSLNKNVGNQVQELSKTRQFEDAIKRMLKSDTFFTYSDSSKVGMYSSLLLTDKYSASKVSMGHSGMAGFGATSQHSEMYVHNTAEEKTTRAAIVSPYEFELMSAHEKRQYSRMVDANGKTIAGNQMMAKWFENRLAYGAFSGGQEHASDLTVTVRPTDRLRYVEREKSEKGVSYLNRRYQDHEFAGLGIRNRRLRATPLIRDNRIINANRGTGYVDSVINNARSGIFNVSAVLNPFTEELIQIENSIHNKYMKTSIKVQDTLDDFVKGAADSSTEVEYWTSGGKKLSTGTLGDLLDSETIQNNIFEGRGEIRIREGSIIGKQKRGQQLLSMGHLDSFLENKEELVRAKVDMVIGQDEMKGILHHRARKLHYASIGDTKRAEELGFKLIARTNSYASKYGLFGERTRSAIATYSMDGKSASKMDNHLQNILKASNMDDAFEATVSLDFYKKTLPKMVNGKLELGKNSQEYLQFLQNSLGWNALYYDKITGGRGKNVILSGDALQGFKETINLPKSLQGATEINLSKLMEEGKLSFRQLTGDQAKLKSQIEHTATILGAVRAHLEADKPKTVAINKIVHTMSDKNGTNGTYALDQSSAVIARQFEALSNYGKNIIETGSGSVPTTAGKTRSMIWGMMAGLMPQEQQLLGQGDGLTQMRISFRDLHFMRERPEILKEIASKSITDTFRLSNQISMMNLSLDGHDIENLNISKFGGSKQNLVKQYKDVIGGEIKTLAVNDLGDMLGGALGQDKSNLKNPYVLMQTLASRDKNPDGFMIKAAGKKIYIPGADIWEGGYMLNNTAEEKATFQKTLMETFDLLQGAYNKGDISQEKLNVYKNIMLEQTTGSKSGLYHLAAMRVDNSKYTKFSPDVDFINNAHLNGAFDRAVASNAHQAEEVKNLYGHMIKQSKSEFKEMIAQTIQDHMDRVKSDATKFDSISHSLEFELGKGNWLSGYKRELETGGTAQEIAEKITNKYMQHSNEVESLFRAYTQAGADHAAIASQIRSKLMNETLTGFGVRYPAIYGGSYFTGKILVGDVSKNTAFGEVIKKLTAGDWDGDNFMITHLMSKASQSEAFGTMEKYQKHAAKYMRMDSPTMKLIKDKMTTAGEHFATLTSGYTTAMVEHMSKSMPVSTGIAAYFTKALTGPFNVKAIGIKGFVQNLSSINKLDIDELSDTSAFFDSITSKITEQEVISSKHFQTWIDSNGGKIDSMETILNLVGKNNPGVIQASIRETGGLHPIALMAAIGARAKSTDPKMYELADHIESFQDYKLNFRRLSDSEFLGMSQSLLFSAEQDPAAKATAALADYKAKLSSGELEAPLMERAAFKKLFGERENVTLLGIMREALSGKGQSEGGFASETLTSILNQSMRFKDLDEKERMELLLSDMSRMNFFKNDAIEMTTTTGHAMDRPFEKRTLAGLEQMKNAADFSIDYIKHNPGKVAGAALVGLVGITAINVLTGDGTPNSPEDLPSVNNPSFSSPRGGMIAGRSVMENNGNYNTNVNLLTDNTVGINSALGFVGNLVGGNPHSITVRSDGQDPYKSDMMLYR